MGGEIAHLVAHLVWHAACMGSALRCSKEFFSQSRLSESAFGADSYSVCAAPLFAVHTLTCVRTLKIPSFGSHAVVCT